MELNSDYWEERYTKQETGWDIGTASTPLKEYINQITNKELKILIPGAGNGHEVAYLIEQGFKNITVVDIAPSPIIKLKNQFPAFAEHFIVQDFFEHNQTYDLIIEQTFFCALDPDLRKNYVTQMHQLLNANGKIAGLLFNFPLTEVGPPFGGNKTEYEFLFTPTFNIKTLENSYNSILPRKDKELFFIFEKK